MDTLWAPWRLAYVAAPKPSTDESPCFICRGLSQQADRENLIVTRAASSVVLLNRFPYNNGHLLVAPREHKGQFSELDDAELLELMKQIARMTGILDLAMHPDGYNIGLNLGRAAGAGLPGHLHWHIVPRWQGDTNFMPVFSDTKVISQSLDALYDVLLKGLAASSTVTENHG
jgi:ATP adenylyltransferase